MNPTLPFICVMLTLLWIVIGAAIQSGLYEDDWSYPQLICSRILCGPYVWVLSIVNLTWHILGLFGRRK